MNEKHLAIQAALELEERGDIHFDSNTGSATPPLPPFLLLHTFIIGLSMTLAVLVKYFVFLGM